VIQIAAYQRRLREALRSMPVTEAAGGGGAGQAVYAQLAKDFPPSAIGWVREAEWSGPLNVGWDHIDTEHLEEWAAGVEVREYAFTAASVGRLALSLHQVIRNHRIALPGDEDLLDELVSVRLRKNSLGIYRLDHDAGQHDDQAIALALGTHHLLDADPEPVFCFGGEPGVQAAGTSIFGTEVLQPYAGRFAIRPSSGDPWLTRAEGWDDDLASRIAARTVRVLGGPPE
jgi:hypothetical protein